MTNNYQLPEPNTPYVSQPVTVLLKYFLHTDYYSVNTFSDVVVLINQLVFTR